MVLFWALKIASRPKGMWLKMALGTLILVPSQVFSMCFRWLREALLTSGAEVVRQAEGHRWMQEVIAYFDQFGFLIIRPLMPILLWLILDRGFINKLWMKMVMAGAAEGEAGDKKRSADS